MEGIKYFLKHRGTSEPWSRRWARGERLPDSIMQVDYLIGTFMI